MDSSFNLEAIGAHFLATASFMPEAASSGFKARILRLPTILELHMSSSGIYEYQLVLICSISQANLKLLRF